MPFKILHIIPSLAKGGAEKLTLDICQELAKRPEVAVKIITFEDNNQYLNDSEGFSIEMIPSYVHLRFLKKNEIETNRLQKAINDFEPDVIHTHLFDAELPARWHIRPNTRYFSHAHWNTAELKRPKWTDALSQQGLINLFVYRTLLKYYRRSKNNFISISRHTSDYYRNNLPGFEKQIHYLPNAINTKSFSNPNFRNLVGKKKIQLLSVGSLIERKNQSFQILVADQLRNAGICFHLLIVGQGVMKEVLQQQISRFGLEEYVSLNGPSNQVDELYRKADVFIHTAQYEPFGLVLVEAMASGLPVVCYDGGGNRELIQNGENGYLLQQFDTSAFARKITDFIKNSERYNQMSQQAVKSVEKYDIVPYVDHLLNLYKSAR